MNRDLTPGGLRSSERFALRSRLFWSSGRFRSGLFAVCVELTFEKPNWDAWDESGDWVALNPILASWVAYGEDSELMAAKSIL